MDSCTNNVDCEVSAPYCVAGTCASSCTQDSECPGAGQDVGDTFCVSGACVQCREGMNDCPSNAPICDSNTCRACDANSDCTSQLCDVDAGTCVDSSTLTYASTTGGASALCTLSDPCSLDRAVQVATSDPLRSTIKMAAGDYGVNSGVTISSGTLTVFGDGRTTTRINGVVSTGGTLRLRDLEVSAQDQAISARWATTGGPRPVIDLDRVTCEADDCVYTNPAILRARRSSFSCTTCGIGPPVVGAGNSTIVNGGSELTFDECLIQAGGGSPAIYVGNLTSVTITNSVVIGVGTSAELIHIIGAGVVGTGKVSFSTLYNVHLDCGTASAMPWLSSDDNIFFAPAPGAPADTVSGNQCTHSYDVIKPQSTNPGGIGNILNNDPMFVNEGAGDFHVKVASPAVNAANPAATSNMYDYDGTTRPQGGRSDIGAFEYH